MTTTTNVPHFTNHEDGDCYVCGLHPRHAAEPFRLLEVQPDARVDSWFTLELCPGCARVGAAMLARMFQDDGVVQWTRG